MAVAIKCPFSNERLYEMYWKQGMTMFYIRDAANKAACTNIVTIIPVRRWLKLAGITIRKPKEYSKLITLRDREKIKERTKRTMQTRIDRGDTFLTAGTWSKDSNNAKLAGKRGGRVRATQHRFTEYETRWCVFCGSRIDRAKRNYKRPPDNTYCNLSCRNKHFMGVARPTDLKEPPHD